MTGSTSSETKRSTIKTVRSAISAQDFYDRDEYSMAVHQAGGPSCSGIADVGHLSGMAGDVLSAIYLGYDPYQQRTVDFGDVCERERRDLITRRPTVFVAKLKLIGRTRVPAALSPARVQQISALQVSSPRSSPVAAERPKNRLPATAPETSSDLTASQVRSMLSAGEFAQVMRMPLDTLVTLDFKRLGATDGPAIEKALDRFLRNFYAWCRERGLLAAYLATVEMSYDGRAHAHCALFVPGVTPHSSGKNFRPEFRAWVREYTDRNYAQHIPRAVHLRTENKESMVRHWMRVHYLIKGYDRSAVLLPEYHSGDHYALRLGDLVAYEYSYAGAVPLKNRIRIAQLLGPAQRAKGAPADCRAALPYRLRAFHEALDSAATLALDGRLPGHSAPFVAASDVACWDVRKICGPEFVAFVNR